MDDDDSTNLRKFGPPEKPLSGALRQEVKCRLKASWRMKREEIYRKDLKWHWSDLQKFDQTSRPNEYLGFMGNRPTFFCNKFTAMYVQPSAREFWDGEDGLTPTNFCSIQVLAAIFKQWFLHYNNEPHLDFAHFFAEPILILPKGPETISGIVESHKLFCQQVSHPPNKQGDGSYYIYRKYYKLLPLYRAVILILDNLVEDPEEDGVHSLDEYSQAQSVLMIRTGDESHLITPISFQQIEAQALPLGRTDWIPEGIEAIRVSLTAAVHFITDIQEREYIACPRTNDIIDTECAVLPRSYGRTGPAHSSEEFAEMVLQDADELGLQNTPDASDALEIAQLAARTGDPVYSVAEYYQPPHPFSRCWK